MTGGEGTGRLRVWSAESHKLKHSRQAAESWSESGREGNEREKWRKDDDEEVDSLPSFEGLILRVVRVS